MDYEEIVMGLENEFDITITDEDVNDFITFNDVYKYVLKRVMKKRRPEEQGFCLGRNVFYKLRKALMEELGASRHIIAPLTNLNTLFPQKGLRNSIRRIEKKTGLRLSRQVRDKKQEDLRNVFLIILSSGGLGLIYFLMQKNGSCFIAFGCLSMLFFCMLFSLIYAFLGHFVVPKSGLVSEYFFNECNTVKELVNQIIEHNSSSLNGFSKSSNYVWLKTKEVFIDCLGLDDDVINNEMVLSEYMD